MRAGDAAVCTGTVFHRRSMPERHEFLDPVSYVWLDPDAPDSLCGAHPLWSSSRPAPARFRRRDYAIEPIGPIADGVRDELRAVLGRRPAGEVRMLTQVRRWGWLFNPITVYVVWDTDPDVPAGAVLEVTNTPWHERHRYPIAWSAPDDHGWHDASTDKVLHVSPFLDEAHRYDIRLRGLDDRIEFELDVVDPRVASPVPTIHTRLAVTRSPATRSNLSAALRVVFPTHRVSLGIHVQALRLWLKRVPFVPHPSKRRSGSESVPVQCEQRVCRAPGQDQRHAADVRADRLLARAEATPATAFVRWTAAAAAPVVRGLLGRMFSDRLVVHERIRGRRPTDRRFGPGGELEASITVVDRRAYAAVLAEGSIGFGRGFIEGWWTSDDPVAVVRIVIRNLAAIDRMRNRWQTATGWATDRVRWARPRDTRTRNRDDIGAHYDIGNRFFELFLDETMTYSSAVFPWSEASLADASRHKYDLLLDKLGVSEGDHLLEIGAGWGGMAIRAAGRGAEVTTTTISSEQLREARKRVANEGVADRVTVLDSDWRDLGGRHDHVVSIEMIEAVDWRDYDDYFATIERCLEPGGRAAIQAITLPDGRWERAKNTEDFIRRFVFPNGFLPSVGAIEVSIERATNMRVVDVDDLTPHYAETLRRWRERFDDRLDEVEELGLDDRFQRLWRFYLAYCEAGFRERHCTLHQIVFAGDGRRQASRG